MRVLDHREKLQRLSSCALGMDRQDFELWRRAMRKAIDFKIQQGELRTQPEAIVAIREFDFTKSPEGMAL